MRQHDVKNVIETIGENENAIENIMGEKRETRKQLKTSFAVNSAGEHKNFDNNVDYDAELRHQRGREQEQEHSSKTFADDSKNKNNGQAYVIDDL